MFSEVVNFNEICSQVTPMQIVCMLNAYFSKLDRLTERHKVYKVSESFVLPCQCDARDIVCVYVIIYKVC